MATSGQLSLNQIVQYFAQISSQLKRVHTFGYGPIEDMGRDNPPLYKAPMYPLMWVEPVPSTLRNDSVVLKHKIYIVDLVEKNLSNRQDVLSDSMRTCMEIKAFIFKDFFYEIFPSEESELTPLFYKYDDEVEGYSMTLDLQLDWLADVCSIPGLYPSGSTFSVGPDYYNVVLTDYLPLAGGTLTGPLSGTSANFNLYLSGGTNLYDIFNGIATGSTATQTLIGNGLNTYTGGTSALTTINVSAATLTYLSATTISGASALIGSGITSLNQKQLRVGNDSWMDIGSFNSNLGGFWFKQISPDLSNFSYLQTGSGTTYFNTQASNGSYNFFFNGVTNSFILNGNLTGSTQPNFYYRGASNKKARTGTEIPAIWFTMPDTEWTGNTTIPFQEGFVITSGAWTAELSATTMVSGFTAFINPPIGSTNMTIINPYALGLGGNLSLERNQIKNLAPGTIGTDAVNYNQLTAATVGFSNTLVQPGLNTYTGGTSALPTINVSAATLTYLSATTISGGTLLSGSTDLYNIFSQVGANFVSLPTNQIAFGSALSAVTSSPAFSYVEAFSQSNLFIGGANSAALLDLRSNNGVGLFELTVTNTEAYFYTQNQSATGRLRILSEGTETIRSTTSGLSIKTQANSTANLDIKGSTSSFAPLRIQSGVTNGTISSAVDGLINYDGTNLYGYLAGTWQQLNNSGQTIHSGFTQTVVATTTFTVPIGQTLGSANYDVNVTPRNALSAAVFYVNNQTSTSFDVVYLGGLTGAISFSWALFI